MTKMTDVEPEGRIGPYCVGVYSNETGAAMKRVIDFSRGFGAAKVELQLVT